MLSFTKVRNIGLVFVMNGVIPEYLKASKIFISDRKIHSHCWNEAIPRT